MEGSFIEVLGKVAWFIFLGFFGIVILGILFSLMRGLMVFLTITAVSMCSGIGLGWCTNEALLGFTLNPQIALTTGIILALATMYLVFNAIGNRVPEAWFYDD